MKMKKIFDQDWTDSNVYKIFSDYFFQLAYIKHATIQKRTEVNVNLQQTPTLFASPHSNQYPHLVLQFLRRPLVFHPNNSHNQTSTAPFTHTLLPIQCIHSFFSFPIECSEFVSILSFVHHLHTNKKNSSANEI